MLYITDNLVYQVCFGFYKASSARFNLIGSPLLGRAVAVHTDCLLFVLKSEGRRNKWGRARAADPKGQLPLILSVMRAYEKREEQNAGEKQQRKTIQAAKVALDGTVYPENNLAAASELQSDIVGIGLWSHTNCDLTGALGIRAVFLTTSSHSPHMCGVRKLI